MSFAQVEASLLSRTNELSHLQSKVRINIGADHLTIDGTVRPAQISHADIRVDCSLTMDVTVALAFLNGQLTGHEALANQRVQVTGWADGKNPMDIARKLRAILHRLPPTAELRGSN